ncbi:radical SAM-linked protein [Mobilisporobacter senegalensis]|uniref:Radical SAM-linked protein n=1 Tax=Mobilisporobacter senegalensis TaxID=1329262 RepID=A0A3N1XVR6_9FIRM|nr:TIGR03936 family radical SAM-associated protein [Mobilisporobacter senegalensis]ROR29272.1 radical SAM-linked protein [Mobilisporobacter senegalensis]
MKARIKFSKSGSMKFIGHLDVMRYFQKAFRRCGINVEYSKGYSPHQIISFAAPLGVGLTSDSEYLDVQLSSSDSSKEMIKQINAVMSEGFNILSFKELSDDSKNAMSIVAAADYLISLKDGYEFTDDFEGRFSDFISQDTITILKKTKKSETMMDIKPFIYQTAFKKTEFFKKTGRNDNEAASVADVYENGTVVYLQLATGSVTNIKPELVMDAFCQYAGIVFNEYAFQYHRLEVYGDIGTEEERRLVSLNDLGTEVL